MDKGKRNFIITGLGAVGLGLLAWKFGLPASSTSPINSTLRGETQQESLEEVVFPQLGSIVLDWEQDNDVTLIASFASSEIYNKGPTRQYRLFQKEQIIYDWINMPDKRVDISALDLDEHSHLTAEIEAELDGVKAKYLITALANPDGSSETDVGFGYGLGAGFNNNKDLSPKFELTHLKSGKIILDGILEWVDYQYTNEKLNTIMTKLVEERNTDVYGIEVSLPSVPNLLYLEVLPATRT